MMSDLSQDLVEEILSRVPLISLKTVRSTCKLWNAISKDRILCNAEPKQWFLGFMIKELKVCSMRFNLHGILNDDGEEFIEPFIKEIGILLNEVEIIKVFYCDGLLLCVTTQRDKTTRLMVWNPYLGQTRWIEPGYAYNKAVLYALGYDDNNNNRKHKILRFWGQYYGAVEKKPFTCQLYDFKSKSWRVLGFIPDWDFNFHLNGGVSLKGNTYFLGRAVVITEFEVFLSCFDFTRERFGPRLRVPFHYDYNVSGFVALSSVREEQLAVLYKPRHTSKIEIWVTTKIEPNAVSWSSFFKVDTTDFKFQYLFGSFFIDQEKKLAVVFDVGVKDVNRYTSRRNTTYITGEKGYLREVDLGEALSLKDLPIGWLHVCSYVPSLVQIN